MQKELLPKVEQFAKQNKRRSVWRKFVRAMACVVVFCTTYALILPAITLERETCTLEEHTHSDSCYHKVTSREQRSLLCSYEILGIHTHTEQCRDAGQNLICGVADFVVHEHDTSCFHENGTLVCALPEIKEHQHSEGCYQMPQVEEHSHTDACYTVQRGALLCQMEEYEGHAHTAECMIRGDLICQLEESEGHVHGDSCVQEESSCELPETEGHIHGDDCYALVPDCGQEETQGHFHEDACYEQISELICQPVETEAAEPVQICEKEEIELHTHDEKNCYETYLDENEEEQTRLICQRTVVEEHVHGESCFVTESVPMEDVDTLTCTLEEGEDHTHSDRCYGTWELICGKEEHIHGNDCMANPAEIYLESITESVVITYSAILREEEQPALMEEEQPALMEEEPALMEEELPASAMFRMNSPMSIAENEVPSWSTPIDLAQYVLYYNGSIDANLLTMGNTVPEGDKIERGKQYQLSLYFAVPEHGMEQGTYVYKFPGGFDYPPQSGNLYDSTKQVLLGTWNLQTDGTMDFQFTEESNYYQTVAMTATIRTTVSENVEQIPFDGTIYVVVDPPEGQFRETQIAKHGNGLIEQNGTWVDSKTNFTRIRWTALFTPGTNGLEAGTSVTDTLTSDLHYFSAADKAAGIIIGFSDAGNDWHQVVIPENSIIWNQDRGFKFYLPDSVCQFCGNKFQYIADRQYYITYYTTVGNIPGDGYYIHQNEILLDGQTATGSLGLQIGESSAKIVKTGYFDPANQVFRWSLRAEVAAYTGGQALYWSIGDSDVIVDTSTGWDVKQGFTFSEDTFESVTAEVDGEVFEIPHISEVTEDDEFCYSFFDNDIFFGHRCTCTEESCGYWIPEKHMYCDYWWPIVQDTKPPGEHYFCTCWTYDKDVVFTFNMVYEAEDIIEHYGGQGLYFINSAELRGNFLDDNGEQLPVYTSSDQATVTIPSIISKKRLPPGPNQSNDFIASFEITVNDSKMDLSKLGEGGTAANISIVDTMSDTLYYIRGTMVITQVDIYDHKTVLHYGTDYDMHVNGHTITIDLLRPGPYQYILDYDAQIIVDIEEGQTPWYHNSASVHIGAKSYESSVVNTFVSEYQYTAKQYSVTLEKTSAHDGRPLPGAVFGLFAESGLEIARDTTDANGDITFETDLKKFIVFKMHTPYYLQEISAPDGYILDDTKHWFYFCNHEGHGEGGTPCDGCTYLNEAYDHITEIGRTNGEDTHTIDIEVKNRIIGGYELPATGGAGTTSYTMGGLLLMMAAAILLYSHSSKRRKEDSPSF